MIPLLDAWTIDPLGVMISLFVAVCVLAIFISVLFNFLNVQKGVKKKEKKSIVETGSMIGFFLLYYVIIRVSWTQLHIPVTPRLVLACVGLILILLGTYVNIWGRVHLGKNWANQVTMYENQTLVTTGPFRFVRHPLYASLVWMFIGGSLLYLNPASLIATVLIFIPFMIYRAKQEEVFLCKRFKEYKTFQQSTGMLFPKVIK